jgi:D-aspartate ligase
MGPDDRNLNRDLILLSVKSDEGRSAESGDRGRTYNCRFKPRRHDSAPIPAVVVGANGPGTLGVVRSLSQASVPVILLGEDAFAPAMRSRYGQKIVISRASGEPLVQDLLALAATLGGPAVLFLNSDDAVLTVSQYRAELANACLFRLPSHTCLTSLIHKTSFQRLAQAHGFPVPRTATIGHIADLSQLAQLRFPCIVKPTRATRDYTNRQFARGYKVASHEEAEGICRRILAVVPDLVVQEWVQGADNDLYFCLQYRGVNGAVCSFTGRKLSIWPPDVGATASCTAAPEADPILHRLTETFFDRVSFVGMGGIEFKRDVRTGEFLMIEPTAGRVDGQEEVATLHGANIPLAAYLHETGSKLSQDGGHPAAIIWRDYFADSRSVRVDHSRRTAKPNAKVYDAYWRVDDPMPALFHLLGGWVRSFRRIVRYFAANFGRDF